MVYGDIGTSPLYTLQLIFEGAHVGVTRENILGVLSLIFWTMTVIVSIKYVMLILRADNNGEGGLIAMLALATTAVASKPRLRRVLMSVGMFGTAIFYGDGVITPAITVLGAMEGLGVIAPALSHWVVPIALVVITALFAVQRFGTGSIGKAFGPITLVWFVVLVLLGLPHIIANPEVLVALDPRYAIGFFTQHKLVAFLMLGAVVLCVTGGEALYADMGHFGKLPIRIAWFGFVMPALVINYFGQGAMLLTRPEAVKNPFYLMAPEWAQVPLLFLSTAAAVIASQALISAAYSVTKQAIQLGLLPRMRVLHTSVRDTGQIYVPFVNWGLWVFIVLAVAMFKTSAALGSAYGIAVTLDMTITTVMTFFVVRYGWKYPLPLCIAGHRVLLRHRRHLLRFQHAQAAGRRLVSAGHRHRHVHADADLDAGPQAGGRPTARRGHRAEGLPRCRLHQPANPGVGHRGVPGRRSRTDAERADAQPEAQQGAA